MGDPRSQKCDSDLGEDETSLLRTSRVGWSLGNTKAFKKGEIRKALNTSRRIIDNSNCLIHKTVSII